jgi:hypothetical protein
VAPPLTRAVPAAALHVRFQFVLNHASIFWSLDVLRTFCRARAENAGMRDATVSCRLLCRPGTCPVQDDFDFG